MKKFLIPFLGTLLAALGALTAAPADHVLGAVPVSDGNTILRETTGFLIGYDPDTRNPEWVAYRLTGSPAFTPGERPSRFSDDPLIAREPSHDDYTRSGYDRGHLASNHVIGSYFGSRAQRESFLMTNIIPQKPGLNRGGAWRELERLEMGMGSAFGTAWIITGPVETHHSNRMPSGVSIPEGSFKIIADQTSAGWRLAPFLFPQGGSQSPLAAFVVPVDRIESLTGIDFFPGAGEAWERLESLTPTVGWLLAAKSGSSPSYRHQPKTVSPPQSPPAAGAQERYWISSTGKTHRQGCRYYGKGNGAYATRPSGNDCKICGGAR
jgi:endonuclease G